MSVVNHKAISVYPNQNGANRCQITTWGVPTAVTAPGNSTGNTPPTFTDLQDGVVLPVETYAAIKVSDTMDAIFCPALTDRSVHITGTANAGSISIQGSNDGTNFVTLHDVFGNALTALAPGYIGQINEECAWIKPVLSGGGGTTAMNVIMSGKRPF